MLEEDAVYFYQLEDKYGQFSNFYPAPVQQKGKTYATNEHYFQSHKFADEEYCSKIASAPTPKDSLRMGNSRDYPLRKDWAEVKEGVMYDGIKLKFTQHKHCREVLLSTGDRKIIEHTKKDSYWGDGGDGSGKNRLGVLLMHLRSELSK